MHRCLTILFLACIANESYALAGVSESAIEHMPGQKIIIPDELQTWSNEPFDSAQNNLLPAFSMLKWSSVSGVLDRQEAGLKDEFTSHPATASV